MLFVQLQRLENSSVYAFVQLQKLENNSIYAFVHLQKIKTDRKTTEKAINKYGVESSLT